MRVVEPDEKHILKDKRINVIDIFNVDTSSSIIMSPNYL